MLVSSEPQLASGGGVQKPLPKPLVRDYLLLINNRYIGVGNCTFPLQHRFSTTGYYTHLRFCFRALYLTTLSNQPQEGLLTTLTYSTYTSEQDIQPKEVTTTIEDFVQKLSKHEVRNAKMGASAFSFARLEGPRANTNVLGLSALA